MLDHSLDEHIAIFEAVKPSLLEKYGPGEWVVVANGEVKDHFTIFADAARYAAREFGSAPALVRQIEEKPEVVPYIMARR